MVIRNGEGQPLIATVRTSSLHLQILNWSFTHVVFFALHLSWQILRSVNQRFMHAIAVPTALTQMAASTAHVVTALKSVDSVAQVNNCTNTIHKSHILLLSKCWICRLCHLLHVTFWWLLSCRYSRVWKRVGWLWHKCKLYQHIRKFRLQL